MDSKQALISICFLVLFLNSHATPVPSSASTWSALGPPEANLESLDVASASENVSSPYQSSAVTRLSVLKAFTPRLNDGFGVASKAVKKMKRRVFGMSATEIISNASEASFAEKRKLWPGVNAFWYATKGWGWRHPENWNTRTYKCVYGMEGRPCGPWHTISPEIWPKNMQCPPGHCCSDLHGVPGFESPLCTANRFLCVFINKSFSDGQCRCRKTTCGENAVCVEEQDAHGGVYCKCKKGMLGNGTDCYEEKCSKTDCTPGYCVQNNADVKCVCPKNYKTEGTSCVPVPMCERKIENLCGSKEKVLECISIDITDWTCVCAPGYAVINTAEGKQCDTASNDLFCVNVPCGTQGVKSCVDLPAGGVRCTCVDGYLLEKEADGIRFKCAAIDPCKNNPCGLETVAKKCTRTASGSYHCECQATAQLIEATDTEGPYCQHITVVDSMMIYAAVAAAGVVMLLVVAGVWWYSFRASVDHGGDYDYTQQAFAGAAGPTM